MAAPRTDGRRAVTSTTATLAGRLAVVALGIASVALTTRYLGTERYGQFALALSLTGLFGVLADAGITTVLLRDLARSPERAGALLGSALALRAGLAAAAVAAAALTALVLPYPGDVRIAVVLAGIPMALGLANSALVAVAQARLEGGRAALGDVAGRAAGLAAVGIVIALDLGFFAVVGAAAVAAAVTLGVTARLVRSLLPERPRADQATTRTLALAALPVGATLAVNEAYFRADAIVISLSRSYEELGHYALAWRIGELAALFPAAVLVGLLPLLSRQFAGGDDARRSFQVGWDVLALAGLAMAAGGAIVAPQLAASLGGESFRVAAGPLRILLCAAGLGFVTGLLGATLIARDLQRLALRTSLVALAVNVVLNVLLVPGQGIQAAAWIALGCELGLFTASLWLVRRHVGLSPSLRTVMFALPALAAMAAAVWPLRNELIVFSVAAGIAVYAAALAALRIPDRIRTA